MNPSKPIILTHNGQNQAEFSQILVRKNAELPYLATRLICHVDCNYLTPNAKRALFVSNREDARRGVVYDLIQQEIVKVLRTDDDLMRLNNEAREQSRHAQDETAVQQVRKEVARLLRLQGINVGESLGSEVASTVADTQRPSRPRVSRSQPQEIELYEPPTYIKFLWGDDEEIPFFPDQRRYIRIQTDANSRYHNPADLAKSRINIIVTGSGVTLQGTTSLQSGRMRSIFSGSTSAKTNDSGKIRIELARPGLPTLFDERAFRIVEPPPARPATRRTTLPPFTCVPVDGLEDSQWANLAWPDDIQRIASSAIMENGMLMIYYSTVFPKYFEQRKVFENNDVSLADSFTKRYEIWLAVHSLLLYQDEQETQSREGEHYMDDRNLVILEQHERNERCRLATMATLIATRDVQSSQIDYATDTE